MYQHFYPYTWKWAQNWASSWYVIKFYLMSNIKICKCTRNSKLKSHVLNDIKWNDIKEKFISGFYFGGYSTFHRKQITSSLHFAVKCSAPELYPQSSGMLTLNQGDQTNNCSIACNVFDLLSLRKLVLWSLMKKVMNNLEYKYMFIYFVILYIYYI